MIESRVEETCRREPSGRGSDPKDTGWSSAAVHGPPPCHGRQNCSGGTGRSLGCESWWCSCGPTRNDATARTPASSSAVRWSPRWAADDLLDLAHALDELGTVPPWLVIRRRADAGTQVLGVGRLTSRLVGRLEVADGVQDGDEVWQRGQIGRVVLGHAVPSLLGQAEAGCRAEQRVEIGRSWLDQALSAVVPYRSVAGMGGLGRGRRDAQVGAVADHDRPLPGLGKAVGGCVEHPMPCPVSRAQGVQRGRQLRRSATVGTFSITKNSGFTWATSR